VGSIGFRPINPAAQAQTQQAAIVRLPVNVANSDSSRKRKASEACSNIPLLVMSLLTRTQEPESVPDSKRNTKANSAGDDVEAATGSGASPSP